MSLRNKKIAFAIFLTAAFLLAACGKTEKNETTVPQGSTPAVTVPLESSVPAATVPQESSTPAATLPPESSTPAATVPPEETLNSSYVEIYSLKCL